MNRRIVCAAMRLRSDQIVAGVRHLDAIMRMQLEAADISVEDIALADQGFLDNSYMFLTRQQAWGVAEAAGQILQRVGGDGRDGHGLFSENLY